MELYFKLDLISILGKTPLSNVGYFDLSNFSKLGLIKVITSFKFSSISSLVIFSLFSILDNSSLSIISAIKKMTEETGFEKDIKRLENEKTKLNERLSNLVDMKLDKIIDNDTYVKKEKELLNKIDEVNEKLNTYKSEIINKDKQIKRLNKIEEVINTSPRLEEFNEDCFKNLIDKIIVGEIDENGNKNPNVIKFILKTGKNYDFLIDNQKYCMSFCKRNKCVCNGIL